MARVVIIALSIAIFGLLTRIFFENRKRLKESIQNEKEIKDFLKKYNGEKKENEELVNKIHSDNNLDSFNASLDLLRKQAEKGKCRNK